MLRWRPLKFKAMGPPKDSSISSSPCKGSGSAEKYYPVLGASGLDQKKSKGTIAKKENRGTERSGNLLKATQLMRAELGHGIGVPIWSSGQTPV